MVVVPPEGEFFNPPPVSQQATPFIAASQKCFQHFYMLFLGGGE